MIDKIKKFRVEIDYLINATVSIKDSAELVLAWRALQLSKGWLGKALGQLPEAPPTYEVVDSVDKIPETKDTIQKEGLTVGFPENFSKLDKVNKLRELIKTTGVKLRELSATPFPEGVFPKPDVPGYFNYIEHSILKLEEAGMQLGFELGRMRELTKEA